MGRLLYYRIGCARGEATIDDVVDSGKALIVDNPSATELVVLPRLLPKLQITAFVSAVDGIRDPPPRGADWYMLQARTLELPSPEDVVKDLATAAPVSCGSLAKMQSICPLYLVVNLCPFETVFVPEMIIDRAFEAEFDQQVSRLVAENAA
jgi:hypothetical protein